MNGLQWKTYKKMDVKRGRGKPNHITIKYNYDLNCWCKIGTSCNDIRCPKCFYLDVYNESKWRRRMFDFEKYRSASGHTDGSGTRSIRTLCCICKWTQINICTSDTIYIWNSGKLSSMVQEFYKIPRKIII